MSPCDRSKCIRGFTARSGSPSRAKLQNQMLRLRNIQEETTHVRRDYTRRANRRRLEKQMLRLRNIQEETTHMSVNTVRLRGGQGRANSRKGEGGKSGNGGKRAHFKKECRGVG